MNIAKNDDGQFILAPDNPDDARALEYLYKKGVMGRIKDVRSIAHNSERIELKIIGHDVDVLEKDLARLRGESDFGSGALHNMEVVKTAVPLPATARDAYRDSVIKDLKNQTGHDVCVMVVDPGVEVVLPGCELGDNCVGPDHLAVDINT